MVYLYVVLFSLWRLNQNDLNYCLENWFYRWLFLRKEQKSLPKLIQKSKILHFSDNISKITMIQNIFYSVDSIMKFQGFQISDGSLGNDFCSFLRKSHLSLLIWTKKNLTTDSTWDFDANLYTSDPNWSIPDPKFFYQC